MHGRQPERGALVSTFEEPRATVLLFIGGDGILLYRRLLLYTQQPMQILYDPRKREKTLAERELDFEEIPRVARIATSSA